MGDRLDSYRWLIVAILAIPLVAGSALLISDRLGGDPEPLTIVPAEDTAADARVYITGAVKRPGVYPVGPDARWIDALEAAGGATEEANLEAVNLARRAQDEDMIVVPVIGEAPASTDGSSGNAAAPVNINTATQAELEELPGIGEVRATRIIGSREADGPFQQVEDLLTRELVPNSVFEDIVSLITVN